MFRAEIIRGAFTDCFRNGRLWLVQFFANPILFLLFAGWLLIPVASNLHLVLNFLLAVMLLVAVLLLHAGTLNSFADRQLSEGAPLWPSFRRALKHLLAVALCVVVFYFLLLLLDNLEALRSTLPAYLRSTLPVFLRRHITLPALDTLFTCFLFFLRWIFLPGLVLPFLAQTSGLGFRGFGPQGFSAWKHAIFSLAYWVVLLVAALLGVLVTQGIMSLRPDFRTSTFNSEAISLAVRLFFAYLFGLFAWMLTCSLVGCCVAAGRTPADVSGNPAA
jgi:hypothetical protein